MRAVPFGKNSSLLEMFDRQASKIGIFCSVTFCAVRKSHPDGKGETLMIAEPRDPRPSLPRFYSSGRGCQLSSPNRERRCQAFYMCHHASSCSEVSRLATKIQELSLARNKLVSLPPFPRARALTAAHSPLPTTIAVVAVGHADMSSASAVTHIGPLLAAAAAAIAISIPIPTLTPSSLLSSSPETDAFSGSLCR